MLENCICALDIGSSKIAAVAAQVKKGHITRMSLETVPARGISKGVIVDSVDLVDAVTQVMKNLRSSSGITVRSLFANISGKHITTRHSRAVIPLAPRGNKVITVSDINKVNEQARILGARMEEEIVHAIPFGYSIDSDAAIVNPLGLYSHRLEVDLFLVCANLAAVQTVTHVVNQAGFDVKGLFFSGLAGAAIVFPEDSRKGTRVLCDIGSDVTELLFFKDGYLKNIRVLTTGGDALTAGLADTLAIPWDLAEDIKVSYGIIGDVSRVAEDKEVLIKKDNIYRPVKQRQVCEIISAGARTLGQSIKEAAENEMPLAKIDSFVVTGRTIFQDGLLEMLESSLGIRVACGRITDPRIIPFVNKNDVLSGQKYLTYLTTLGIVSGQLRELQPRKDDPLSGVPDHPVLKIFHKFKEVYQEYF
ncbi:MAG: cell division protein FtsA [Candidatus Omnitrophica bacterium]|nr:cell division protein FtsA [Candidatus Omnitrophota bacterium]MDD5774754.1 cell division protein FtsA [Candidatus Omnitrophota bacterium]